MTKFILLMVAAVLAAIVGGLLALGVFKALQLMFGPASTVVAFGLGVAGVLAWCYWYGR